MPRRRVHLVLVAAFVATIAAPGLVQTAAELRRGERPGALDVFRRPPTARHLHAYERELERASLVVRGLRPWVQFFEWKRLDDAGDRAVVGRDGWLFYRPSVRYTVERAASDSNTDPLPAIRAFRDQLQARGIGLLLVPVPNKECVYPERLSRQAEGQGVVVCEPTRRLLERLRENGISYVDLFEVFRHARRAESRSAAGRLYQAQDSHWSPQGARLAAGAVARRVLAGGGVRRGQAAYAERAVTVRRYGDLVEMLQAPPIEHSLEPEALECLQVVEPDTGMAWRAVHESDVLVLGDSFLRVYEHDEPGSAGFLAHLARELGQPLSAIVNDGGAATLVRRQLAHRPALLRHAKLVIWEFAEREIRFGMDGWQIVPLPDEAESTGPR